MRHKLWMPRVLRANTFANRVGLLVGGTAAGQIIALAATPLIVRIFSPEELGTLAVYIGVLSISTAVMLRYESGIAVAPNDFEAVNLLVLCAFLAAVASAIVTCVVVVAGSVPPLIPTANTLGICRWLVPIGVLGTAIYIALSFWAIRRRWYRTIARTKLTQNLGMVTCQLSLGLATGGPAGLVVGHIVGQSGGVYTLLRRVCTEDMKLLQTVTLRTIFAAAVANRRFPMFSFWAAIINAVAEAAPVLFIASYFGKTTAGIYTVASRLIFIPTNLIAGSASQVVLGELSELATRTPESLRRVFTKRVRQAFGVSVPIVLAVAAGLTIGAPRLLGATWKDAAACAIILSPAAMTSLASTPFACALDVTHRQELQTVRELLRLTFMTIAIAFVWTNSPEWRGGVACISGAMTLSYVSSLMFSWAAVTRLRYSVTKHETLELTRHDLGALVNADGPRRHTVR